MFKAILTLVSLVPEIIRLIKGLQKQLERGQMKRFLADTRKATEGLKNAKDIKAKRKVARSINKLLGKL